MTNLDHILTHIEASAPCTLFGVAAWADAQLTVTAAGFVAAVDALTSSNKISISQTEDGLIVDLI